MLGVCFIDLETYRYVRNVLQKLWIGTGTEKFTSNRSETLGFNVKISAFNSKASKHENSQTQIMLGTS